MMKKKWNEIKKDLRGDLYGCECVSEFMMVRPVVVRPRGERRTLYKIILLYLSQKSIGSNNSLLLMLCCRRCILLYHRHSHPRTR